MLLLAGTSSLLAQSSQNKLDLAVTYTAERSLKANASENFWMQGGSIELGADVAKGFGIAANITGTHSSSIGSSGVPLSLVTIAFGPRYRWHGGRKLSIYGEGLTGEADGFFSLFPSPSGTLPSSNSLATQLGGGIDYRLSDRFAIRALDAAWLRTQLPNATDNIQNTLQLGAGLVVRFGR
jgi:hypothetical protein